ELGGLALSVGIGPGAARAVEAVLLIQVQQGLEAAPDAHLPDAAARRFPDRAQPRRAPVALADLGRFLLDRRLRAGNPPGQVGVGDRGLSLIGLIGCSVFVLRSVVHAGSPVSVVGFGHQWNSTSAFRIVWATPQSSGSPTASQARNRTTLLFATRPVEGWVVVDIGFLLTPSRAGSSTWTAPPVAPGSVRRPALPPGSRRTRSRAARP